MSARPRKRGRRGTGAPQEVAPSITRADLEAKTMPELKAMATELTIDVKPLKKKDELIDAVLEAKVKSEGFIEISGILDILPEGYGFIRTSGYLPGDKDVYCSMTQVRRYQLRRGDMIHGQVRPPKETEKYAALLNVHTINGKMPEEIIGRRTFNDLTPIYPDERLRQEHGKEFITARVIDLVAPIGKGQRGLIVSPPKAGKTTVLKDIAASITANNPEIHLLCLLVDERPEEVTDMERSIHGEVISSTFDMPSDNHIAVAELVMERAKRLVESGYDVVVLLDSITRLARAYNLATPASGRILSGGVDSTALYPPKKFFGAARNIEFGGSLTILATALVDTGSKMDEVIFEEFKGTGNLELRLDRGMADRRIFPAIDVITSGTRKEELLLEPQEAPFVWGLRRVLHGVDNPERAMDMLVKGLKTTESNHEFLVRMAKQAQSKTNGIEV
jgi:transcription termination factor Rho